MLHGSDRPSGLQKMHDSLCFAGHQTILCVFLKSLYAFLLDIHLLYGVFLQAFVHVNVNVAMVFFCIRFASCPSTCLLSCESLRTWCRWWAGQSRTIWRSSTQSRTGCSPSGRMPEPRYTYLPNTASLAAEMATDLHCF